MSASAGLLIAWRGDGKWRDDLRLASITLVFVALIGGVVKLLLEHVQIAREQRAEQARFVQAVLDDLKSVYDRVDRARGLIRAHRSALTYGNEMRNLIEARVQLKNVERALDTTSGISAHARPGLEAAVGSMKSYLEWLNEEFEFEYKSISDEQKVYEARVEKALEQLDAASPPPAIDNQPWRRILQLPRLSRFIQMSSEGTSATAGSDEVDQLQYDQDFLDELDKACLILREELQAILGGSPTARDAAAAPATSPSRGTPSRRRASSR